MGDKLRKLVTLSPGSVAPLILMVGAILLVVTFLPIWLIVAALAKVLRPDLTPVTHEYESALADEMEKSSAPDCFNVMSFHIIDGHVSTSTLRQMARENLMSLKDAKGQLMFSRLQERITSYLGYPFWKVHERFNIDRHIRDYDYREEMGLPNPCFEEDLKAVTGRLVAEGWEKDMPCWEILLVHNYHSSSNSKPQTALLGRWHHSLMDGYGYIRVLEAIFLAAFDLPKVQLNKLSAIFLGFQKLLAILKIPMGFAEEFCDSFDTSGLFHRKNSNGPEFRFHSCVSLPIEHETILKLSKTFGVAYGAVVTAIFCSALKRLFQHAGQPCPDSLAVYQPFPLPHRPKVVCNHFDARCSQYPLRSNSRVGRLRETHSKYIRTRNRYLISRLLRIPLMIAPNTLASFILKRVMLARTSFILSVFLAQKPFSLGGYNVVDGWMAGTPVGPKMGGSCGCYGTPNQMRLTVMIHPDVIKSEEAVHKFSEFVREETRLLETLTISPDVQ